MPLLTFSDYKPPWWLPGGHAQTIYPAFFRKLPEPDFQTVRLDTPDRDFLELDITRAAGDAPAAPKARAVILSHGLEGHSRRQYILGMARAFLQAGWDTLAWNFRCCSPHGPVPNLQPRLYHSGETEDLRTVIRFALEQGYARLLLIGFSMGGNQILKLLGEEGRALPAAVQGGIVFSVPCDLTESCRALSRGFNRVYVKNFLRTLIRKIRLKHEQLPDFFDLGGIDSIRSFKEFDDRYTAPLHGFSSAEDYWAKSSCRRFLEGIERPVLLVNARNDPFLPEGCYPKEQARSSRWLWLETPAQGGHVGFSLPSRPDGLYWSELRALEFARRQGF